MHVLITGITGFIGTHLARRLEASGVRVSGLVAENVERIEGLEAQIHQVDICDAGGLAAAVASDPPDAVVHLAGLSHVGESFSRPGDYLRINFAGTRHLLRAAAGRRVIFASSSEVYGPVPEGEQPLVEDRPLEPRSPYALTKACAEQLVLDAGGVVARSFNAVGPGQAARFALPSFAAQLVAIARGEVEPVIRVGDLSPRRDFLHVADAAVAYQTLIEHGEPGGVYNLASGVALSIGEALERLCRLSGVEAKIERDPERFRPVDLPLLCGDATRLERLGWRRERGLDEALEELWHEVAGRRR